MLSVHNLCILYTVISTSIVVYYQYTTQQRGIVMAISEARRRANEKYNAKAYEQIQVRVKTGEKAVITAHAASIGETTNAFIRRAIFEAIEREQA